MNVTYSKEVFEAPDMDSAKNIILTTETYGGTYHERWECETKYTMELIEKAFPDMGKQHVILDFGCGIGRMSKALIEKYGCCVIGVDISERMRKMAQEYIKDERFSVLSYESFNGAGKAILSESRLWNSNLFTAALSGGGRRHRSVEQYG